MNTAQQKRKENIAEYILYLFQIEDLIRAFQFNISNIETNLVSQYLVDEEKDLRFWNGIKIFVL